MNILAKLIINTLLLLSITFTAYSQHEINGYIKDAQTGERLPFAAIFDSDNNRGTTSNEYGFFSIKLKNNTTTIVTSYVGYKNDTLIVDKPINAKITIKLHSNVELDEVEIIGDRNNQLQEIAPGNFLIPIKTITSGPQLLGEADVFKTIQLLPGVSSGNEGYSGYFVRGGSTDQNLVLLDDVPVYNANHLFGIFSVFNADALKAVNFMKGGFPAKYGGRLSSVLDIRLKDGNEYEHHGKISVGLVSSKILLEGPIKKEKATYLFSARRTYIDMFLLPVQKIQNSDYNKYKNSYYFYDIISKISIKLKNSDKLYFSFYTGKDKAYTDMEKNENFKDKSSLRWGNITASARWNHAWQKKTFSNLTLTYTKYNFETSMKEYNNKKNIYIDRESFYSSGISDVTSKIDFNSYLFGNGKLYYGIWHKFRFFNTGENRYRNAISEEPGAVTDTTMSPRVQDITESGIYVGFTQDFNKLTYDFGIRYVAYKQKKQLWQYLEPRASITYKISSKLSLRTTYDVMSQNIHLLSNSTSGLPTDLWVPATDSFPPSTSQNLAFGASYTHKGNTISVDIFYKEMNKVIAYKNGSGFKASDIDWENKVENGKGTAYGLEILIQKKHKKFDGWLAYTLSKSERKFPQTINNGKVFPYKFDRRHVIDIVLNYKITKRLTASIVWNYASGINITLPQQKYLFLDNNIYTKESGDFFILNYGDRNSYKLPASHRLDLAISLKKKKKWGTANWQFGIYNVYNRANPYYVRKSLEGNNKFEQVSLLPILPYVTYNYEF